MIYAVAIVLIILLALGLVALSYRGQSKAEQRHAELQQRRAEAAEFNNANRQQLDTVLESLHEIHREETVHAANPTHLAERSDFDNDWSADAGLHDSGTITHPSPGAAAAESTGAAVHFVNRPDLS